MALRDNDNENALRAAEHVNPSTHRARRPLGKNESAVSADDSRVVRWRRPPCVIWRGSWVVGKKR